MMNRRVTALPAPGAARRRRAALPSLPPEAATSAAAGEPASSQRILECMEGVRGAQVAAIEACVAAIRDAIDASLQVQEPARLAAVHAELLQQTMELAGRQGDVLRWCFALQSELAQGWADQVGALVPGWPGAAFAAATPGTSSLETAFDGARKRFEEAAWQWFDAWTVAETPNAVVD
jgi:hypothetical protein